MTRKIPRFEIEWIVGNFSVTASDEEVRHEILRRCQAVGAPAGFSQRCAAFAVRVHDRNRDLYRKVARGV